MFISVPAIHTWNSVAFETGLGWSSPGGVPHPVPARGVADGAQRAAAGAARVAARAPHAARAHPRAVRRAAGALHRTAAARQDTR